MEIKIADRRLSKILHDQRKMYREYGQVSARKIQERLDEIRLAKNLRELKQIHPRLHERTGNQKGLFSVDLDHPFRMIMIPDHDPLPLLPSGGIDLRGVDRVEIVRAKIDDHGKRKGLQA